MKVESLVFSDFFTCNVFITTLRHYRTVQFEKNCTPRSGDFTLITRLGCKWSKTVPIMVESHQPPFAHVEIVPTMVRNDLNDLKLTF